MARRILHTVILLLAAACCATAGTADDEVKRNRDSALLLIKQGNYPDALTYFQKALAISPQDPTINSGIGNVYAAMKQCDKGIPYLHKAQAVAPNDETALFGLGACYMDLQKHEQAIPYLEKVVALRPDQPKPANVLAVAYVRRGIAFGRDGQNDNARKWVQKALELFQRIGNAQGVSDMEQMLRTIPKDAPTATPQ